MHCQGRWGEEWHGGKWGSLRAHCQGRHGSESLPGRGNQPKDWSIGSLPLRMMINFFPVCANVRYQGRGYYESLLDDTFFVTYNVAKDLSAQVHYFRHVTTGSVPLNSIG